MRILATVIEGEADFADVLFLIAVIVFAVAAVIRVMARSVDGALVAGGLAVLALGVLVL